MNKIYIVLQVGLSLYCLDLMIGNGLRYEWGICMLGVHMVCYLLSHILDKEKIIRSLWAADGMWLVGSIVLGTEEALFLFALLVAEIALRERNKKYLSVMAFSFIGIAIINVEQIRMSWGMYLLIGVVGYYIYSNDKKIRYLMETNQSFREQIIKLNNRVEEVGKAKLQIEDITRINERNRLAQRLHDKIGHTLAGNIMQLEVVKLIFKNDEIKAIELLTQITDNLRSGMDDIRMTLRELKPEQSEMGIQKIKQLLVELENKHRIKTYLVFEGDLESIDIRRWQIILDNLQEAITNMIKYSNGDEFKVSIQNFNQIIRVSYEDNGKVEGRIKKGLGLIGMEERMVTNQGRMSINTEVGFQINMIFNK